MLRVLLVDDQALFRDIAKNMFSSVEEFEVVAEAEDGADAIAAYSNLKPDLVLMDVQMPRVNGLEATKQILSGNPDAKVVITSMRSEPEYRRLALDTGALGFIAKRDLSISALRDVLGGAFAVAA
ncbi:MAG: response regulator transcription factor [Chloroflexi bacterium]|nr:response regulator transcription factor [Chloroflexota bacterium]